MWNCPPPVRNRNKEVENLLREFSDSGRGFAEIECEGVTPRHAAQRFYMANKRIGLSVSCSVREGRLFLIRKAY
jgi:hypothetical protein